MSTENLAFETNSLAFTEFVFKTNSRCNLQTLHGIGGTVLGGCDYCYEYAAGNESWREQPAVMNTEVIAQGARRIGEHANEHELKAVRVIKHGGEPLLGSANQLAQFSDTVQNQITRYAPDAGIHLSVQTNGILLTPEKTAVLKKYDYTVGLSLDGDKAANDLHRLDRQGNSTYEQVVEAAGLLQESGLDWGILSVIDTRTKPHTVLDSLAALKPGSISLLLPHATHENPPIDHGVSYGEWLKEAFDWYLKRPDRSITMPIFDAYVVKLLGGTSTHEHVGYFSTHELFILPNGSYQRVDTLKATEPHAVEMSMNVFDHSLDEVAAQDPGVQARRMGKAAMSDQCLNCPVLQPCGGGYYPHRYKPGDQELPIIPLKSLPEKSEFNHVVGQYADAFRNPTVYCKDNLCLITHIEGQVAREMHVEPGTFLNLASKYMK